MYYWGSAKLGCVHCEKSGGCAAGIEGGSQGRAYLILLGSSEAFSSSERFYILTKQNMETKKVFGVIILLSRIGIIRFRATCSRTHHKGALIISIHTNIPINNPNAVGIITHQNTLPIQHNRSHTLPSPVSPPPPSSVPTISYSPPTPFAPPPPPPKLIGLSSLHRQLHTPPTVISVALAPISAHHSQFVGTALVYAVVISRWITWRESAKSGTSFERAMRVRRRRMLFPIPAQLAIACSVV